MKTRRFSLALGLLFAAWTTGAQARTFNADVCVYGGTSAGVVAAVQAGRMGQRVFLAEPSRHLGGMTSGGLSATDIGNPAAIGGVAREFYHRVAEYYEDRRHWKWETPQAYFRHHRSGQSRASSLVGPDAVMYTFEPHVAERIFHEMLLQAHVAYRTREQLASVKKQGARITQITMVNGDVVHAAMFIDATYEGDLMAKAGCAYFVGREANAKYGETLDGIRAKTPHHQFLVPVDPYVKPGDPASGLLPYISSEPLGTPGAGDHRVQAYNLRLCFTTNVANRLPLTPPPHYNPAKYELLARYIHALIAAGKRPRLSQFWGPIWLPNQKADINNNGPFSTDFIGMDYAYPDADYATRRRITLAHENYLQGFVWFLATDPRVPASLRHAIQHWGPCKDEFTDHGGWPTQLYVREARRLIGVYVMTEKNCRHEVVAPDSIGLGSYNMDSHNIRRLVRNGHVKNEGDVEVPSRQPYPISYRSLLPKPSQCVNLLVPVCLSASHIGYGSIRMEPVFMILGQAAGTAAALAHDDHVTVQRLNYAQLRTRLLADKQILTWKGHARSRAQTPPLPKLPPIVTYWAGPAITDATARRMKEGGWNLIWCHENELAVARRHGLRAMLTDKLLQPSSLDDPIRRARLEALVRRVRHNPALYNYFITDEPSAQAFPGLGRLVAFLKKLDPAHPAYINLFPTYATNRQLGTHGDTVTAYKAYLHEFLTTVKPALISYDHYHFRAGGRDGSQYFLNLGLIRQAALGAHVPFLNIVQACSWTPSMRVPNGNELRWLAYTSLAYGAQGLSYFVYSIPHILGGMMVDAAGNTTPLYAAAREINPAFIAIAKELQPLRSEGAFLLGTLPPGTHPLPENSPFQLDPRPATQPYVTGKPVAGWLVGLFGRHGPASDALVVNLDYSHPADVHVVGSSPLEVFDVRTGHWSGTKGQRVQLHCRPGEGVLVRRLTK